MSNDPLVPTSTSPQRGAYNRMCGLLHRVECPLELITPGDCLSIQLDTLERVKSSRETLVAGGVVFHLGVLVTPSNRLVPVFRMPLESDVGMAQYVLSHMSEDDTTLTMITLCYEMSGMLWETRMTMIRSKVVDGKEMLYVNRTEEFDLQSVLSAMLYANEFTPPMC